MLEEPADERDAVRHAALRAERGKRMFGVRRPVAARLLDLHEPGRQGQRRVAGEVRDSQNLVAQRGSQQQVPLLEIRAISVATFRLSRSAWT
jgi:hypothetical protein